MAESVILQPPESKTARSPPASSISSVSAFCGSQWTPATLVKLLRKITTRHWMSKTHHINPWSSKSLLSCRCEKSSIRRSALITFKHGHRSRGWCRGCNTRTFRETWFHPPHFCLPVWPLFFHLDSHLGFVCYPQENLLAKLDWLNGHPANHRLWFTAICPTHQEHKQLHAAGACWWRTLTS